MDLSPAQVLSMISKAKCRGKSPDDLLEAAAMNKNPQSAESERIIGELYADYAKELRLNNALDFDDLLLYGVELLKKHPSIVNRTRHVLVDELYVSRFVEDHNLLIFFAHITRSQDTNSVQFELMELLASAKKCISIVGDPDQSSERLLLYSSHPID